MKKILFIIIDGLADEPIPAFGGQTPLEAGQTPFLDSLAQKGRCGLILATRPPTSEHSHLALFGYDPQKDLPGRGVLEALGSGLKLLPGDVSLRANLATIDEKGGVLDRRAGRIEPEQAKKLIKKLNGIKISGVEFIVRPIYSHRLVVILRGRGLSEKISDTDDKKIKRIRKCQPLGPDRQSLFTSQVLTGFLIQAHNILKNHPLNKKRLLGGEPPANFLLVRGPGRLKKVVSFEKKWGLRAICVSKGSLYRGVARFLGMGLTREKGGDSFSFEYLREKFLRAKFALKRFDFVFCHVKGADILAEDGNFLAKKEFIETIDKALGACFGPLSDSRIADQENQSKKGDKRLMVITADHATCSLQKSHCSLPCPLLIYGSGQDKATRFSEKACKQGPLSQMKASHLMPLLISLRSGRSG